ncbi:unnamed protein product [Allacma fusca]|uniref:Uncharacterized protein n=1 Tax=Allacma fusca TaxID=39272 RepID=A0A8J2NT91_9HEXA|nr:unnamed protein product [Allacma fusca]
MYQEVIVFMSLAHFNFALELQKPTWGGEDILQKLLHQIFEPHKNCDFTFLLPIKTKWFQLSYLTPIIIKISSMETTVQLRIAPSKHIQENKKTARENLCYVYISAGTDTSQETEVNTLSPFLDNVFKRKEGNYVYDMFMLFQNRRHTQYKRFSAHTNFLPYNYLIIQLLEGTSPLIKCKVQLRKYQLGSQMYQTDVTFDELANLPKLLRDWRHNSNLEKVLIPFRLKQAKYANAPLPVLLRMTVSETRSSLEQHLPILKLFLIISNKHNFTLASGQLSSLSESAIGNTNSNNGPVRLLSTAVFAEFVSFGILYNKAASLSPGTVAYFWLSHDPCSTSKSIGQTHPWKTKKKYKLESKKDS